MWDTLCRIIQQLQLCVEIDTRAHSLCFKASQHTADTEYYVYIYVYVYSATIGISDGPPLSPAQQCRTRDIRDWDQNTLAVVMILSPISAASAIY